MDIGGQETTTAINRFETPGVCGAADCDVDVQLDERDADGGADRDADSGAVAADERGTEGGDARGGVEFVCFFCGVVGACGNWGGGFVVRGVPVFFSFFSLFLRGVKLSS